MSKTLACPHETADSNCEIHHDFPDRFPERCHGPKECFGAEWKKHLEAIQIVEEKPKRERTEKEAKSKKEKAQPATLFDYMGGKQ